MSYNPLPEDINGNVLVTVSQEDIFGHVLSAARTNQISNSFFSSDISLPAEVQLATTGTGSATSASGKAIFQTGSATTSSCSASTFFNIYYSPGYEVYTMFTTTWTTPTSASSLQLIGLWDIINNGFYLGYNGITFGTAVMSGGVQTFTPRSSWNGDLLDGSATSKFTRNRVPEAINFSNLNLFRIRFGWLGAAPILYEVCSPDGEWIIFHTISQPNNSPNPSIQNPNLPISLYVQKTGADSTNLVMSSACWAAGTSAPEYVGVENSSQNTWTSSTAANTAISVDTVSAGNLSFSVSVTGIVATGSVIFEMSPDNRTWFPLTAISSNHTQTATSTYNLILGSQTWQAYVGGYAKARIRLVNVITGSGTVVAQLRPTSTSASVSSMPFQPDGSKLHVTVDSGAVELINSSTGLAPSAVPVGITSTSVVASNLLRKGLILVNTSNKIISLGLDGNVAVLYSGITLMPSGSWIMDSYTFTTGAITAIASAAGSNLAIQEMQ